MSKFSIKVTNDHRLAGEYDGAETLEAAVKKAKTDFVPHVPERAGVMVVTFSECGEKVHVEKVVKASKGWL